MPKPHELPPQERGEFLAQFKDHATYCRECLTIPNLSGSAVPLELANGQRKLSAMIERQERAGKPVRIVVLKIRRGWFTTEACSEVFHRVPHHAGVKAMIVADHYRPAGMEAFGYLQHFDKSYRDRPFERFDSQLALPDLVKNNEQTMEYANGSMIEVYSADTGEIRGGGRHIAVLDEYAFWRNAEQTGAGVMNAVPKRPGTMVIVLSTANGVGGEFYDLCMQAQDPTSDTLFEFLFFGWLEHEQYTEALKMPANEFVASLDAEERLLQDLHGATLEQLQWRRTTIATECAGKLDLFHQEYPTTAEEAFIHSGRPALDMEALARHEVIAPASIGDLKTIDEVTGRKLLFVTNSSGGDLSIWRKPEKGRRYVIGADPSRGIDVSVRKRGENPDFSVAFVADQHSGEQVALLRGRIRPVAFAQYLALLGRFYNWAFMCPESNDAGFIDAIVNAGYPLELLYHQQRDPTDLRTAALQELGFYVTGLSRSWLISAIDDAIREMSLTIHSQVVVVECQTFVKKPDGKVEHMENKHDDCVFAAAHCEIARRAAPRKAPNMEPGAASRPGFYGRKRRRDEDD